MADVVGVVFPNGTKTYYFDPGGLELARGDRVVVQTANGPEIGQVVEPSHAIEDSELPAPLKKVTRLATGRDLEAHAASENLRKEAMITCREMIAQHGLDMKLVGADISFGGEKITFSFFAEERVDFRSLVADLAKTLKTRIELRQVGAREEARMVGGLGPCGRGLCCTLFPPGDDPVSIRMAKEQNLPLNPAKISGLCGRLMCCLKYEQEQYVQFRKEAPAKGTPVQTPGGQGAVVGYNVLKDAITIRLEDGHTTDIKVCCCQCQADGGLLVVPELGEPTSPLEILESVAEPETLPVAAAAAEDEEELAIIEAEVVLGEDGQPLQVVVAEGSRRRRRGRGRRGGRGRAKAAGEAGVSDEAGASAGAAGGRVSGAMGESGRSGAKTSADGAGVRHQGQHAQRHPERHRGGVPGHKTEGGATSGGGEQRGRPAGGDGSPEGGQEAAAAGSSSTAKRRRRRRRPGGGNVGEGPGNGGNGNAAGAGASEGGA